MQELKQKNIGPWSKWNSLQPHFCNGLSLSFGILKNNFRGLYLFQESTRGFEHNKTSRYKNIFRKMYCSLDFKDN